MMANSNSGVCAPQIEAHAAKPLAGLLLPALRQLPVVLARR